MQARVLSAELPSRAGQQVDLKGWVHRVRDLGGVRFLILRDRAGLAQIVLPARHGPGRHRAARASSPWRAAAAPRPAPPPAWRSWPSAWRCCRAPQPRRWRCSTPTRPSKNRLETLLDHRAVSLRIPEVLDVFRVQDAVLNAFRAYLRRQGFTEIVTPKLVLAGAEGGSAVFKVEYFEQVAYLAQSPQFYKQMMVGSGLERVFEVGHAYRAEKSETSRHLTEYVSLDFEMGFIESVQDVMRDARRADRGDLSSTCARPAASILGRRGCPLPQVGRDPAGVLPAGVRHPGASDSARPTGSTATWTPRASG